MNHLNNTTKKHTEVKMNENKFYIDKTKELRKSIIIYKVNESIHSPIMYLSKPKWVSQEEFDNFFNNMIISVKQGGKDE